MVGLEKTHYTVSESDQKVEVCVTASNSNISDFRISTEDESAGIVIAKTDKENEIGLLIVNNATCYIELAVVIAFSLFR